MLSRSAQLLGSYFPRMSAKTRRKSICAIAAAVVLLVFGLWLCTSSSHIKVAGSFTPKDTHMIRIAVSEKRRAEVCKSIAAHDFKRLWNFALPVWSSRIESISGFPGPPGGARVECRGLLTDTECSFMVFNDTNGWKCDSIDFIDASAMRQIRELQKQYATKQY